MKIKNLFLSFLRLSICLCFTAQLMAQMPHTVSLNADWKMIPVTLMIAPKSTDLGQNIRQMDYALTLPNTVLTVLWQNQAIENPYMLENARRLEWLEKKDWTFECQFDADNKILDAEKAELILRGVDTYASVFLNDVLVLKTDNAFKTWSVDVINLIQPQNNTLRICFISPINKNKDIGEAFEFDESQSVENKMTKSDSLSEETLDKRRITIGLQSVELKAWSRLKLEEVFVKQNQLSAERADLEAQTLISVTQPSNINIKINCGTTVATIDTFLKVGTHRLDLPFVIKKPQLWWTKNLGKPYLYDIQTVVTNNKGQSDVLASRTGLRRLTLIKKQNGADEAFSVQLNGVTMADENPSDAYVKALNERIKQGDWRGLVEKVAATKNAVIYLPAGMSQQPSMDFYRLCDEQGILIWQDFILSNMVYMNNSLVTKQLEMEALEQVRRLRSYACVGIWCGNLEPFKAFEKIVPADNRIHTVSNAMTYEKLFQTFLPKIVLKYTNQTIYDTQLQWKTLLVVDSLNTNIAQLNKPVEKKQTPKEVVSVINKGGLELNKPVEKKQTPKDVISVASKGAPNLNKPVEQKQTVVELSQNTDKGLDDVVLLSKIENDTFKLTVKNDRVTRAMGDFLVDVYDTQGRLLFNDARMMRVEASSSVQFYRYDLKTMMQGKRLSDIVFVTTWKDAYNNRREMKNTFHIDPTTLTVTKDAIKPK